ncbi:endonuclease/exonuclease/phosphatase family protein [Phenylobacterium sp.]|uniref:endonuclease/exonuclease/phosphatase family protein n=1 Tax=Phenylobacterium sp. TaxID=1871053 RepID=UPI00272F4E48|nr:endonuclease/exonuclease/phosphatase family protein [Phenylobacterium sp.]MDP1619135.1 endonuclease/exonuclease/phosphatase family protein [Phenylobacterium sp.]MDP1986825.1 endonuclease/exonuclease/phosphatase family protein [Phenylobacterium sp.]
MRIVTLNTWKNEGRYDRRLVLMAQALGELAPDVVCLQEAFQAEGFDTAAFLGDALGLAVSVEAARRKVRLHAGQSLDSVSGLAILSRGSPQARGRIALPSDPADGERIAQWIQAAPDLRILNLHLTHLRGPDAADLRGRQLAAALAAATSPGSGLLVVGDFNAPATAPELAAVAAGLDPSAPPTLQGERAGSARHAAPAIDHAVLVDAGPWRIVLRFRGLDQPDAEGWFPSDHAAIVVDLQRA